MHTLIKPVLLGLIALHGPAAMCEENTATGRVIEAISGHPLAQVAIRMPDLKRSATTDAQGQFRLKNLPPGRHLVCFSRQNLEAQNLWLTFPLSQPLEVSLQSLQLGAEVTVTASPWALHPMEAAQPTGSVTQEAVIIRSGMSLGEAIAALPGVRNVSTGDASGVPMIRGMVNERVRVLDGGIGINHQGFSRRHMPTVEPLDAGHIDVVRGPASVLFGSQAIGGVVNLVPAPLPMGQDQAPSLGGKLTLGHGTGNESWVERAALEGAAGKFGWRASATERQGGPTHTPDGEIPNTDFRSKAWSLSAGYAGTWGRFTARARHFGNQFGFYVPGSPAFRLDLQDAFQTMELSLYPALGIVDLTGTHQQNHRKSFPNGLERPLAVDLILDTNTFRSRLRHCPAAGCQGDLALEVTRQTNRSLGKAPSGMKTLLPDYDAAAWAASLFEEWRPGKEDATGWILSLGLRHDQRDLEILPDLRPGLGQGMNRQYEASTGSLGAIYRFNTRFSVAANLARGWRHPSEFELFAAGPHDGVAAYEQGNPDLREEKNLNLDLSARFEHPRLRASLTLFHNRFKNFIYLYQTAQPPIGGLPVLSFDQSDARIRGLEAEGVFSITRDWELQGNFERLSTRNEATGKRLPFAPPDRASLGTRWNLGAPSGFAAGHVGMRATWTGLGRPSGTDEPFGTRNGQLFETASSVVWSLEGGLEASWGGVKYSSGLAVQNLLDKRYVDFLDTYKQFFPAQGRSIRLTLSATF